MTESISERKMKHFSHEHPLVFNESDEIPYCCNACGLHVLLSPSYICPIQDCNFYLHQACTRLPHEMQHYCINEYDHYLVKKRVLALSTEPRDENSRCGQCGELCKNFTYHCLECKSVLHPQCGFPLDIQIKHISHPQHPLVAISKQALLLCDVCGREHKGYFFSCHQCNFWIHQDCALLPTFVKVEKHPHYLFLLHSAAPLLNFLIWCNNCLICGEMSVKNSSGFYYCHFCYARAHVHCVTSETKSSGTIFHLPTTSDDTFPSLTMRAVVKERTIQESESENMLEKYHAHSLVLIDDTAEESVCNACIQPISPPYYRCSAQSGCNFLLHKFCADLPLVIDDSRFLTKYTSSLAFPRWDQFFSLFRCCHCFKYSNGFGYLRSGTSIYSVADLECDLAPKVIRHDSHKQHPLILTGYIPSPPPMSCCRNSLDDRYHCSVCNFSIHINCALRPKTVTHKFDKHPLTLIFPSCSQHHPDGTADHLCEFCEEDIDPKYWFYSCIECDHSFHVDCIPSQGKYSKIKFGGTVKLPCHNDHPLKLVRMMSIGSQKCGHCQKIIQGFKDGMSLHCADCDFWIHFKCGYYSCSATVSPPFEYTLYFAD